MSQTENDRVFGAWGIEVTTVAIVTTLMATLAWYRTDLTGVQALTNSAIAALVTAVSMTVMFSLIRAIDPHWYRP